MNILLDDGHIIRKSKNEPFDIYFFDIVFLKIETATIFHIEKLKEFIKSKKSEKDLFYLDKT